jgi:hypothetical protein
MQAEPKCTENYVWAHACTHSPSEFIQSHPTAEVPFRVRGVQLDALVGIGQGLVRVGKLEPAHCAVTPHGWNVSLHLDSLGVVDGGLLVLACGQCVATGEYFRIGSAVWITGAGDHTLNPLTPSLLSLSLSLLHRHAPILNCSFPSCRRYSARASTVASAPRSVDTALAALASSVLSAFWVVSGTALTPER